VGGELHAQSNIPQDGAPHTGRAVALMTTGFHTPFGLSHYIIRPYDVQYTRWETHYRGMSTLEGKQGSMTIS
jgi:hypothetical protein